VAANHCRVGHVLATLIARGLSDSEGEPPESLRLDSTSLAASDELSRRYPESTTELGDVVIRFAMLPAPEGSDEDDPEAIRTCR
jgi:hypothetical protein